MGVSVGVRVVVIEGVGVCISWMAVMLALACVVGEDVRLASRVEVGVFVCSVEVEVGVGVSAVAEGVLLTVIVGEELAVAADSEGMMPY